MKKYIIEQYETVINRYEVIAKNKTEALLSLIEDNDADFLGQVDVDPEINHGWGMSFEQAPSDIDLDVIRSEFNSDRNSEYIESIHSIEEEDK